MPILLFNGPPNTIIGQTDTGIDVFMVFYDAVANQLYFIQFEEIDHPDTENHDDTVTLVGLSYTVTDGDGDHISAEIEIKIEDDGPTAEMKCLKWNK